jgi:hypothetical protein
VALDGWRLLRAGSGPGAVLGVDFTQAQVRAQANFGDLAPNMPDEYAVWGTDETAWPSSAGAPRTHLDTWLHHSRGFGAEVRGVLGFCAGATLACSLAGSLATASGVAVPVVLFDPVTVAAWTLVDQFDEALTRMVAIAGEPAVRAARLVHSDRVDERDLAALATLLARRYAAVAGPACADQGIPDSITDQLCQRVETNLRFLAMCATAAFGTPEPAALVLSRDHVVPPALRGAREVRLDVGQNELLADPDAARVAAGVLAGDLTADRP